MKQCLKVNLYTHMGVCAKSLQLCPTLCNTTNTGLGCHALFQGGLPDPGIEPESLKSPELAGRFLTWEAYTHIFFVENPN